MENWKDKFAPAGMDILIKKEIEKEVLQFNKMERNIEDLLSFENGSFKNGSEIYEVSAELAKKIRKDDKRVINNIVSYVFQNFRVKQNQLNNKRRYIILCLIDIEYLSLFSERFKSDFLAKLDIALNWKDFIISYDAKKLSQLNSNFITFYKAEPEVKDNLIDFIIAFLKKVDGTTLHGYNDLSSLEIINQEDDSYPPDSLSYSFTFVQILSNDCVGIRADYCNRRFDDFIFFQKSFLQNDFLPNDNQNYYFYQIERDVQKMIELYSDDTTNPYISWFENIQENLRNDLLSVSDARLGEYDNQENAAIFRIVKKNWAAIKSFLVALRIDMKKDRNALINKMLTTS